MKKAKANKVSLIKRVAVVIVSIMIVTPLLFFGGFNEVSAVQNYKSLPGIEKIKTDSLEDPFRILEIVPEYGSGSLSYYIPGYELSGVYEDLSKLDNPQDRSDYFLASGGLLNLLEDNGLIVDESDPLHETKAPLTKTGDVYEEYLPWEENAEKFSKIELKNDDNSKREETATIIGLFEESESGNFSKSESYQISDDTTKAKYDLSYDSLKYQDDSTDYYVNPTFSVMQLRNSDNSLKTEAEILSLYQNQQVYNKVTDSSDTYYEYLGVLGDSDFTLDRDFLEDLNNNYYFVESLGKVYEEFSSSSPYAIVNSEFIELPEGETGNFEKITTYSFEELGGEYRFVAEEDLVSGQVAEEYSINYSYIYADLSYENNDWFRKYVFDEFQSSEDSESWIQLREVAAKSLTEADVQEADLIVVSSGFSLSGEEINYSVDNDISSVAAESLIEEVVSSATNPQPKILVFDYKILSTTAVNLTSVLNEVDGGKATATGYVENNVYVFSGEFMGDNLVTKDFYAEFSEGSYTSGNAEVDLNLPYNPVYKEIVEENKIRLAEGALESELLPVNVSIASSIRYALNAYSRRDISNKSEFNVLEISPATGSEMSIRLIRSLLPDDQKNLFDESNLKITTMSLAEFNSKTEDIAAEYDMLYFSGSLKGVTTKFNLGGELLADYNEDVMDGLMYSGVGDVYKALNTLSGLLNSDYDTASPFSLNYSSIGLPNVGADESFSTYYVNDEYQEYRTSGNDITQAKMQEVIDFANAGFPVIISDNLLSQNKAVSETTVNAEVRIESVLNDEKDEARLYVTSPISYEYSGATLSYQWYKDGNLINGATREFYYTDSIGEYYCMVNSVKSNTLVIEEKTFSSFSVDEVDSGTRSSVFTVVNLTTGFKDYSADLPADYEYSKNKITVTVPDFGEDVQYVWYARETSSSSTDWKELKYENGVLTAYADTGEEVLEGALISDDGRTLALSSTGVKYSYSFFMCEVIENYVSYYSAAGYAFSGTANFWLRVEDITSSNSPDKFTSKFSLQAQNDNADSMGIIYGENAELKAKPTAYLTDAYSYSLPYEPIFEYQWYRSSGGDYQAVSGATNETYTHITGDFSYRCVIKLFESDSLGNKVGAAKATSTSPAITVSSTAESKTGLSISDIGDYGNIDIPILGVVYDSLDENIIDDSSLMFRTFENILNKTNVISVDEILTDEEKEEFYRLINLSKPNIVLTKAPTDYTDLSQTGSSLISNDKLDFEFEINTLNEVDPINTKYELKIFIDINSDGVYSSDEELNPLITDIEKRSTVEDKKDLIQDVKYSASVEVTENFAGIIPWKFEIVKVQNNNLSDSINGLTYKEMGEKPKLDLLQILPLENFVSLDENYDLRLMLQNEISDLSGVYDFNIAVKSIEELNNSVETIESLTAEFLSYDVIMIGPSDSFGTSSSEQYGLSYYANTALENYINADKSLILTGNALSYSNLPSVNYKQSDALGSNVYQGVSYSNYFSNLMLRDEIGLDKYGVTDDKFGISQYSPLSTLIKDAGSFGYTANGYFNGNQSIFLDTGVVESLLAEGYSLPYLPKSDESILVNETQGYSQALIAANLPDFETSLNVNTGAVSTVSQQNSGQITSFPYNLNDVEIGDISAAKMPVYALNTNLEDLRVWYTLGLESVNPSNNYFVYSYDNVFYFGAGGEEGSVYTPTDYEKKLLMNTILASYQITSIPPEITFQKDLNEMEYAFVPADLVKLEDKEDIGESVLLYDEADPLFPSREIYFIIEDENISEFKSFDLELYYQTNDKSGEVYYRQNIDGIVDFVPIDAGTVTDEFYRKIDQNALNIHKVDGENKTPETILDDEVQYVMYLTNEVLKELDENLSEGIKLYIKVDSTVGTESFVSVSPSLTLKVLELIDLG